MSWALLHHWMNQTMSQLFRETVQQKQLELLSSISIPTETYLTGGTALSLQIGLLSLLND